MSAFCEFNACVRLPYSKYAVLKHTHTHTTIEGIVTAAKDGGTGRSNAFGLQQLAHAQPGTVHCSAMSSSVV
jgi:hypothetical protein